MKFTTRQIAYLGFFVALHIILSRIASFHILYGGVEYARIGFGAFPLLFCSLLLGPKAGMTAGMVGDIVGYHLNPAGPYLPHFTVLAGLNGLLPGLWMKVLPQWPSFWRILAALAATQLPVAVVLTPYVMWSVLGIPLIVIVPPRIVSALIMVPLFAYLAEFLHKQLKSGMRQQFYMDEIRKRGGNGAN